MHKERTVERNQYGDSGTIAQKGEGDVVVETIIMGIIFLVYQD